MQAIHDELSEVPQVVHLASNILDRGFVGAGHTNGCSACVLNLSLQTGSLISDAVSEVTNVTSHAILQVGNSDLMHLQGFAVVTYLRSTALDMCIEVISVLQKLIFQCCYYVLILLEAVVEAGFLVPPVLLELFRHCQWGKLLSEFCGCRRDIEAERGSCVTDLLLAQLLDFLVLSFKSLRLCKPLLLLLLEIRLDGGDSCLFDDSCFLRQCNAIGIESFSLQPKVPNA
mmetsp:Transcript_33188/g.77628  ORF Transcript_33188/g.77628 Transcript_33188/m.77628 type:complete len:229 (-) Transcript_33188:806-1492(-)